MRPATFLSASGLDALSGGTSFITGGFLLCVSQLSHSRGLFTSTTYTVAEWCFELLFGEWWLSRWRNRKSSRSELMSGWPHLAEDMLEM